MSKLKKILSGHSDKVYMIAEIGINHNGDMQITKKLLDATFACDWDCAKFQKRDPNVCVPEKQKSIMRETPWGEMSYIDYKYKVEFEKEQYDEINKYCLAKPLDWTVSVWDQNSLEFVIKNYNLPFIKIPSAHITNLELVKEVANSKVDCIVSTGMSDWDIVDNVVNILEKQSARYALLHCNSTYPAPLNELNLSVIPKMKERYGCIIGYSGHEPNLEPTIIAITLGAQIIERHVTLDHNMWGTDQKSSLEVLAMDMLKKRVDDISVVIGKPEKIITDSEKPVLNKLRG